MYACWAAAGYECHESADVPVPLDRCLGAVAEFNACASDLACEYGCRAGQQQDCAFSADFDACVATCEEDVEQEDFVADCESRLHIYAACLDREDAAECGGILHGDDHCAREAIDVGGCLADELLTDCEGWCWAAEHLECAPDECVDFCETGIDPDAPCGDELHEMIHCVMFFGDGACLDGILVGAGICERDTDAYRACIGSATGSVDQHAGSHGR
jgi:hypothetical protein